MQGPLLRSTSHPPAGLESLNLTRCRGLTSLAGLPGARLHTLICNDCTRLQHPLNITRLPLPALRCVNARIPLLMHCCPAQTPSLDAVQGPVRGCLPRHAASSPGSLLGLQAAGAAGRQQQLGPGGCLHAGHAERQQLAAVTERGLIAHAQVHISIALLWVAQQAPVKSDSPSSSQQVPSNITSLQDGADRAPQLRWQPHAAVPERLPFPGGPWHAHHCRLDSSAGDGAVRLPALL